MLMTNCIYQEFCGGCAFRGKGLEKYRADKENNIKNILKNLAQKDICFGKTVFLD